ncbi:MAG: transglutaminase domain-containing protein [Flavobacteriaceae bacterium]
MRISIAHETHYAYAVPARQVVQILRLTPRSHTGQHVVRWSIDVDHDCRLVQSEDSFGNITHTFTVGGPVGTLAVRVSGIVETEETHGVVSGAAERLPPALYLRETPLTGIEPPLRKFAEKARSGNPLDTGHALTAAIFERMTFDTEATDTLTTAAEAFREKHGVCQDFAHLFIACARSLGLPARYVSGYFVHQNGQTEHEAGHAWAELLVPDLGWVGFDPANAVCAGENYVRVACGLDYLGAAPVRGIQSGGNDEALKVAVKVSQTDHMADRMADNQ